jgi:hypothetical protein
MLMVVQEQEIVNGIVHSQMKQNMNEFEPGQFIAEKWYHKVIYFISIVIFFLLTFPFTICYLINEYIGEKYVNYIRNIIQKCNRKILGIRFPVENKKYAFRQYRTIKDKDGNVIKRESDKIWK